mmetsp:Transcript_79086/g.177148  ORF Transcript_79086/g.177148 Transcript_79086/m.177148 type:complete len:738 (-) Transcript_79086:92-2305(-)
MKRAAQMASLFGLALLATLSQSAQALNTREGTGVSANPIRRVVTMLESMQKKVAAEGKLEEELFEKYQCYCKTGSKDLDTSISTAEAKITQVDSTLKETEEKKAQLGAELAQHESDRTDAKEAIAKATALREKEASAFSKESSDAKTNIDALAKAIDAIEKGASGSFLQTAGAATLRRISISMEMSSMDRDLMSSFLSQGQEAGYAPKSGQIVGILKQMKETMEKDLAEITGTEEAAIADFNALVAAKDKEIKANTKAIEEKLQREGEAGVEIVNLKEDLEDTKKSLAEDQQFLADLTKGCDTKAAEWEERSKTRAEELKAIAETITILNDDDALDLFKKTLPSPALLQTQVSGKEVKRAALRALQGHRGGDARLDLIALALKGHATSFEKVLTMIDEMVALLGKEQKDDDSKKAYCGAELDKAEDDKKVLDQTAADLTSSMEEATEMVATLTEEVSALEAGIKELDKSVADATENRKTEHEEYVETMAADTAAKKLIEIAQNRLAKFYAPHLYKPPPERELTEEERISTNFGGTLAPTAAPGGIAGTGVTYFQEQAAALMQVSSHSASAAQASREAPDPPPETWGAYKTKGEEHMGVVEMLNMLKADLDKEMQEIEIEEKDGQAEYEKLMADSAAKRAADGKSVADKEGAKADLNAELEKMSTEKKSTVAEAMAKAEYIQDLHLECDWLVANFEVRKEARAGEVASLKNAKAVLSGSDYALVQTATRRGHLRGGVM